MNPALVTVAVAPKEQGTRVRIGAYALEGLIKQRAARKAATRIAELLGPHGVVAPGGSGGEKPWQTRVNLPPCASYGLDSGTGGPAPGLDAGKAVAAAGFVV